MRRTGLGILTAAMWALVAAQAWGLVAPPGPQDKRVVLPPPVTLEREPVDAAEKSPEAASARAFLARNGGEWEFAVDRRTGRPVLVEGSGIPFVPGRGNQLERAAGDPESLDVLETLALEFLSVNAELLQPASGVLELDREHSSIRDSGRLATLYFRWSVDGVPVELAHVFLRLNSGNLIQFGAPLVGTLPDDVRPTVGPDEALDALMAHTGDGETYRLDHGPELLLQPEDAGTALAYRLVWRMTYRVAGRIETWEGRVDARTGQVVGFRDTNAYGRVIGGVFPRSVFEQNEISVPLPRAAVVVEGLPLDADDAGSFSYAGGAASSGLNGRWFDTACQGCSNPATPIAATTLGTGLLDFGAGGLDQTGNGRSTPSDRNTFYHLNQIRRVAQKWLPGLPWLGTTIVSNVNLGFICNAFYDGAVNFFRSGGGCNNSGEIADIIYHEWGHGLDLNTRGGDGATGEATADVVALHLSHSAVLGPGFETTGTPVRNLDPNGPRGLLTTSNIGTKCTSDGDLGPLGYEVHCEGEIYGQTSWTLAQSFVTAQGLHTGWRTSERLFFTSLPDAGGYLPTSISPIYNAYLVADDDDGNLANGTPHAGQIYAAFNAHGIAGGSRPTSAACARPAQPVLVVTPGCTGFNLSWSAVAGAAQYQILRGELRSDQALFPVASLPSAQTTYTDTKVAPGMDYGYVVMTVNAAGCESTIENPVPARLADRPLPSLVAAVVDDTPRGNRSGYADPGEEVDLWLDLQNSGPLAGVAVTGTLVSTTSGVEILDGRADWGTIAPGATATNLDTLRFRTLSPLVCGDTLRFQLVPQDGSGCSLPSYFTVELGNAGVCDPTPPCFVAPIFSGLGTAVPGASCAETVLSWQPAESQCQNAQITYNVYRGTDAGFLPTAATRVAEGIVGTAFSDTLLAPGATYYYIVRANDSRSGEDGNFDTLAVAAAGLPDTAPPVFGGLLSVAQGADCGETVLSFAPGFESCSLPVSYEIYRSTNPSFVPGPSNRIGSSLSASFVDVALEPGAQFTYVVRARDSAGNESANLERLSVASGVTDRVVAQTGFEQSQDGWTTAAPNDATTGNWEWGLPEGTAEQPGACAGGGNCWVTGLLAILPAGGNNDVDGGTTTLLSRRYGMVGAVDPVFRYSRWFTNDQGAAPGEDPLIVEVSANDGASWTQLESVGAGTPLAWVDTEIPLPPGITPSANMRLRFKAADLGSGSLVEAGIDDFAIIDRGQGCAGCPVPTTPVGTIFAARVGDDVVLDWSGDPTPGTSFAVYLLSGAGYSQAVRVGTTSTRTFVHEGAALSPANFAYRVTAVDACGNESSLN